MMAMMMTEHLVTVDGDDDGDDDDVDVDDDTFDEN